MSYSYYLPNPELLIPPIATPKLAFEGPPNIYRLNLGKHDKKEFSKLTKVSNYINSITGLVEEFKKRKISPYVMYGKELLDKLNYILELRLGSDEYTFNNASILIGQSVTCLLQLAHEYIRNGNYYLGNTYKEKYDKKTLNDDEKEDLKHRGYTEEGNDFVLKGSRVGSVEVSGTPEGSVALIPGSSGK